MKYLKTPFRINSKASNARNPCAHLNFLFFITEIQG